MKKYRHLFTICFLFLMTALLCSFGCFAEVPTEHKVVCSYNDTDKTVTMQLFISKGTAIVGYCSFDYDSSVLTLLDTNGSAVPNPVPTQGSYIKQVISAKNGVVITDNGKGTGNLINTTDGYFLFAWYLPEKSEFIDASKSEVLIAEIKFALKDGKTYENITNSSIAFASAKITDKVDDWKPGLRVMNNSKTLYYFDPDSKTNNSEASISFNFDFGQNIGKDQTKDDEGGKTETPTEDKTQTTPDTTPTKTDVTSFGIALTETESSIKIKWNTPDISEEIISYSVAVTDTDKNIIRQISNISPITTSLTVKDIASDYGYIVSMTAVSQSGKEISSEKVSVHTPSASGVPSIIAYTVIYDAGKGYLYGFEKEEVIFGKCVQKIPDVIPPDGYAFRGWSQDGKSIIDITNVRIYDNITYKALYITGSEAASPARTDKTVYINGYNDGTFRPNGNITRAEISALFARLCKEYSETAVFTADFNDCKTSDWYTSFVGLCVKNGIINGYSDNTFRPSNNVTRGEFAAMLCRLYGFEQSSVKNYFDDISSHWAKGYINTLFEKGIAESYEDNTFRPDEKLTRLDAVLMLNAAQRRTPDKNSIDEYVNAYGEPFKDIFKSDAYYYDILEAATDY